MKKSLLTLVALLAGTAALAAPPRGKLTPRPAPCQEQAPQRSSWPQGTMLWGTTRHAAGEEASSVLTSIDLRRARLAGAALTGVRLQDGHLVAPSLGPKGLVGARFQGTASDGRPVEVALCSAEPAERDPSMSWYRIEIWNARSESWENPCVASARAPDPRVVAVQGVWDGSGARHEASNRFTFACENGVISKCIEWGYKPWASKDGHSLKDLHQACTRMARADYCGNGHSHTWNNNTIDMYDGLGLIKPEPVATAGWDPARASFEAAWTPEGARCVARMRTGQALETLMAECPGVFEARTQDFGEGDVCTLSRKQENTKAVLLRNRSYDPDKVEPKAEPVLPGGGTGGARAQVGR